MRYLPILLILFLSGCAATFQPSGSCTDGQSYILSATQNNPSGLDKALLIVNFSALEKKNYTAQEVADFLDTVEQKVKSGVTYLDLADYLIVSFDDYKRYIGASMILLGDQVSTIGLTGGNNVLSACDTQLILAHIANQRRLVGLY